VFSALAALEHVTCRAPTSDVLVVGALTEEPVLGLFGHGFGLDRVRAAERFSYSPWVDACPPTELPYAADAFDLVLAFDLGSGRSIAEAVRVARPRAVVAIVAPASALGGSVRVWLQRLEASSTDGTCTVPSVFFQSEPASGTPPGADIIAICEIAKSCRDSQRRD
jgi:hypothetical protein